MKFNKIFNILAFASMFLGLNACSNEREFPTNNFPTDKELTEDESQNNFATPENASFYYGADPSFVTMEEAKGCKFYGVDGKEGDCFEILRNIGFNAARFRVWVEPEDNYCYIDDVIEKAERAAMVGQRIMIDFHYSDSWADPTKQNIPSSFASAQSLEELAQMAADYTKESLTKIQKRGIDVTWVQIGNESHRGIMCDGTSLVTSGNYEQYMFLHNACAKAAKEVYPNVKTIVHFANANRTDYVNKAIEFAKMGADFDIFGVSLYPNYSDKSWYQNYVEASVSNLNNFVTQTGKDVMFCEVGSGSFDYKGSDGWTVPNQISKKQATAFLNDISYLAKNEIQNCKGVFFWEPQCYNKAGENYHLGGFTQEGRPSEGLILMCSNPEATIYDPEIDNEKEALPNLLLVCGIDGWDNEYEMTKKEEGLFEIDLDYKKSLCKWGFGVYNEYDKATSTIWDTKKYYSTDNQTLIANAGSNDNIKFADDDVDGIYTLLVNLNDMTMSLTLKEASSGSDPEPEPEGFPEKLIVCGIDGWDNEYEMTKKEEGLFEIDLDYKKSLCEWGFGVYEPTDSGAADWSKKYSSSDRQKIYDKAGNNDNIKFASDAVDGIYTLTINLNDMTMSLTPKGSSSTSDPEPVEITSATVQGLNGNWSDIEMTQTSTKGVFEVEVEITSTSGANNFGFTTNGTWNSTIGNVKDKGVSKTGIYKLTLNTNNNSCSLTLIQEKNYGVVYPEKLMLYSWMSDDLQSQKEISGSNGVYSADVDFTSDLKFRLTTTSWSPRYEISNFSNEEGTYSIKEVDYDYQQIQLSGSYHVTVDLTKNEITFSKN